MTAVATDCLNLLVVDDEPAMRALLKQSLESAGHHVIEAADGHSALEVVEREDVDLVLTDLRMEGLTGIDVLKAVKQQRPKIGVMLITGFATLESAMEAMRLGAIDVIQKPVNMSELAQKIADYAAKRTRARDAAPLAEATRKSPQEDYVEVRPPGLPPLPPIPPDGKPDSLEKVLDIPVSATVQLGKTTLQIADLLKLSVGSVVELNKRAGEPVELYVNDRLIALGEVVVIDETFGLRVTSIVEPKQRIQSLE
jgi:flagellar motor switch protein FliN